MIVTKYILKTDNDLRFDFFEGDMIDLVKYYIDGKYGWNIYEIKAEKLEKIPLPILIDVGESHYLIVEVVKVLETRC